VGATFENYQDISSGEIICWQMLDYNRHHDSCQVNKASTMSYAEKLQPLSIPGYFGVAALKA